MPATRHWRTKPLQVQAVGDGGLLFPCNVIVREQAPERVMIGSFDPQVMVNLANHCEVKTLADAAKQRLRRACGSHRGGMAQAT